jgi:hypothetical protein
VVLDEARSLHVDFRHLPGCFFNGHAEPLLYDLDSLRNGRNHAHAQSRSCRQDLRSPSAMPSPWPCRKSAARSRSRLSGRCLREGEVSWMRAREQAAAEQTFRASGRPAKALGNPPA